MSPDPPAPVPTVAEVDAIARLGEPVIRNLQITQAYHELSAAFLGRLGPHPNWCTFAAWASRQAGQTIRGEDLRRVFAELSVTPAPQGAGMRLAAEAQGLGTERADEEILAIAWELVDPAAAVARAGEAVARGNLKVFEEIAREFARFAADCRDDTAPDRVKMTRWCAALREGDPPEGQDYLRRAFAHYYAAFFEPKAKARLELVLLANLEIGFHEQTRLQPEIVASLDAGFVDRETFQQQLLAALYPYHGWLVRLRLAVSRLFGGRTPLDRAIDAFLATARAAAHLAITEHLMTIGLPGDQRLHLGDDLPAAFPTELRQLGNATLVELLRRIDPTPDSVLDSGALDWGDLPERLHFIADLFRCYAATPDLFAAPYSGEQVAAIKAGRVPGGPL